LKLIAEDHQTQFETYARQSLGFDCLAWDKKYDGIENLSMRSFIRLHEKFPILKSERYPSGLSIAPGITVDDEPNAFAARNGEHHFVGVSSSLAKKIVHYADLCFCQPFIYQGKYGSGQFLVTILEQVQRRDELEEFRMISEDLPELPEDPERRRLSLYVSCVMFRFVLLHEFAHCFLGHIDYLTENKKLRNSRIYELDLTQRSSGQGKIEPSLLHYLEQEADISALDSCLRIELSGECDFDTFSKGIPEDQRIELILFAAYLMLWLLASTRPKNADAGFKSHPVPSMRLRYLYQWASATLGRSRLEYVLMNHSAMSQLKSIDTRLRSGWMDEDRLEQFQLEERRRQSVTNELKGLRYMRTTNS
jgi:hypothetical protein